MKTKAYLQERRDSLENQRLVIECGNDMMTAGDFHTVKFINQEISKIDACLKELEGVCFPMESY